MPQEMGLVASSRRNIRSGKEYAHLFAGVGQVTGKTNTVKSGADVFDTLTHIKQIVKREYPTTRKVAGKLLSDTQRNATATLKALFDFMYWHYQYKIDTPGKEELRTPLRAWHDRATGIDCDCYSVSVSSILVSMIKDHGAAIQPPVLRIIKMYNRPYYQHIYVIVPKYKGANLNVRSNYWVIDPVLDTFDKEAPYTAKHDTPVMELQELSGINAPDTDLGREFDGFGHTCDGTLDTYNARMYNHIAKTRNAVAVSPAKVQGFYKPQAFINTADTVLRNWHNENTRAAALAWASNMEMGLVHDDLDGLQGLLHGDDRDLHEHLSGDIDYMEGFSGLDLSGLGATKKGASVKTKIQAAKAKIAPVAAKANTVKNGIFTKVKNAEKVVKATANNAKKKVNVETVKKVVKSVQKVNPVAVAMRNAFLLAMNLNVGQFSTKLKLAYGSQSEAEKAGYNWAQLQAAKNEVEKIFVNIAGGNATALRNAIVNHKNIIHKNVNGMGSVLVAAGASTAAATPLLTKVGQILSKLKLNPAQKAKFKNVAQKAADFAKEHKDQISEKAKQALAKRKNGKAPAPGQNPASDEEQNVYNTPNPGSNPQTTTDAEKNTPDTSKPDDTGKPDNDGKKSGSGMMWFLGAAAVVALAVASSSSSSKPVGTVNAQKVTHVTL